MAAATPDTQLMLAEELVEALRLMAELDPPEISVSSVFNPPRFEMIHCGLVQPFRETGKGAMMRLTDRGRRALELADEQDEPGFVFLRDLDPVPEEEPPPEVPSEETPAAEELSEPSEVEEPDTRPLDVSEP